MSDPIERISEVSLPSDLVNLADPHALLESFAQTFSKLGSFKEVRDKHADRGVGEKIWSLVTLDDTMEVAQLDAVETQEAFSKLLGQLMVLSVAQAKQLQEQQLKLSSQQETLISQTARIEEQAETIARQQADLARQNKELEQLIREHLDLKGLTLEGAAKLINVAQDVQSSRDVLLETFRESTLQFRERVEACESLFHLHAARLEMRVDKLNAQGKAETHSFQSAIEEQGSQVRRMWLAVDELNSMVKTSAGKIEVLTEGFDSSFRRVERASCDLSERDEENKRRLIFLEMTVKQQGRRLLALGVMIVIGAAIGLAVVIH